MQMKSGRVTTQYVDRLSVDRRDALSVDARLGSPTGGSGRPLPFPNRATTAEWSAETGARICRNASMAAS